MGIMLFLAAAVMETAFMVLHLITKSYKTNAKSVINIAMLPLFGLLPILSVIGWSFRYYVLASLLLVQALAGAVQLIRKEKKRKAYSARRAVLNAGGRTMLFFLAALPAILFPEHSIMKPSGNYQVASAVYTYTDTARMEAFAGTGQNRRMNVEFWYPETVEGTYPLIIFSHGGMSVRTSNESLYHELASNGYVVCAVDHTYHSLYTTFDDGRSLYIDMNYMQELQKEDARYDRQQSLEYYQKWMRLRTDDIQFVMDQIITQAGSNETGTVYGLVDASKIGVMGHSLGGSAALGIGRMREDVGAVIALESPFLCDITGVLDGEFVFKKDAYPVPVLNVYSDSAWSILDRRPQYAQNIRLLSKTHEDAFYVYLSGTGHFSLTDLALTSPAFTRMLNGFQASMDTEYCLKVVNSVCLQFFDCYLKEKGEFTAGGVYFR